MEISRREFLKRTSIGLTGAIFAAILPLSWLSEHPDKVKQAVYWKNDQFNVIAFDGVNDYITIPEAPFEGTISLVKIFNRRLTDEEINQIYRAERHYFE